MLEACLCVFVLKAVDEILKMMKNTSAEGRPTGTGHKKRTRRRNAYGR